MHGLPHTYKWDHLRNPDVCAEGTIFYPPPPPSERFGAWGYIVPPPPPRGSWEKRTRVVLTRLGNLRTISEGILYPTAKVQ